MKYEVCPGQTIVCNGTRYPSGSIAPDLPDLSDMVGLGIVRPVAGSSPARPQPVARVVEAPPHAAFDPSDPPSVKLVPLRWLGDCLSTVEDGDILREMHAAETRKGGLDKIEERLGELDLGVSE